jgi:YbbR domain-containing protein
LLSVLRKNLPLKVLSIVLAVFLWTVISRGRGGEMMEISLGVPLELHNLPADMDVLQGPVERVDVRFSGPRRLVSKLSHQSITIPLDLTGAAEGETTFELFTSDIKVPERVTVTRVSPSNINIVLERIVHKSVPVILQTDGIPKNGYQLGTPKLTPSVVEIKGPGSIISSVEHLMTSSVNIQGASETIKGETSILFYNSRIHHVNRSTVKFEIPIFKKQENQGPQDGP